MVFLFGLILMRMSGAIAFNPIFGRNEVPPLVRGALTFACSLMLYVWTGGVLAKAPDSTLEFAVMAIKELMLGFVLGFGMQLAILVIRFGTAIIDYMMGLSMAQVYDPASNTQMTVSTQIYYMFMMLVFMVNGGHLRFLQIVFGTAKTIPFGQVTISPKLPEFILAYFCQCIVIGTQFAMPIIVIELLTETAIGVMMRFIPQINIFAVSFQIKLITGLAMLFLLFVPMSSVIDQTWNLMFEKLDQIVTLMMPG
ncbi:MAG: flagellar biosynthetic protein FliR [Eubacterium sp.]|nr:flagellar biosynthetic protein FliR [Eubacterium sp.]